MGGSSGSSGTSYTVTDQTSKTGPWGPTWPILGQMLNKLGPLMNRTGTTGMENRAFDMLRGNLKYADEHLPQMQGLLADLFKGGGLGEGAQGIRDSWSTANTALTPIARGDFVSPESNPYLQDIVAKTQGDISNRIGGMFAGSGRSFSGAHMKALGSGVGDATNALYYNAYSGERDRQSNAIRDLMSGSLGAAGGLDATLGAQLGARQAGAQLAPQVTGMRDDRALKMLELQKMQRALPYQNLGMMRDFILPIAGLGSEGEQHGWSTTQTQTQQQQNPFQQILGGALGLGGLFGGMGGFGGLGSLFGSAGALAGGGGGGGASPAYWMNPWSNFFSGRGLY